jgi:hypothetical protein
MGVFSFKHNWNSRDKVDNIANELKQTKTENDKLKKEIEKLKVGSQIRWLSSVLSRAN